MSDLVAPAAESYAEEHTSPLGGQLERAAAWTQGNTPSPQMMSGLAEARLLELLVVAAQARNVLEIGTFTGVGALIMAAAVPADGSVTTLEEQILAPGRPTADRRPIPKAGPRSA